MCHGEMRDKCIDFFFQGHGQAARAEPGELPTEGEHEGFHGGVFHRNKR